MFQFVSFLIIIAISGGIFYHLFSRINNDEIKKEKEIRELKKEVFTMKLDQKHIQESLWKTKRNLKRVYREIDPTGNNISYDK